MLSPGVTEAAARQQLYKTGAKIKIFALIRSRNQFLLLLGFFLFTNFCSFTRVINMLPFEEKKIDSCKTKKVSALLFISSRC